jgi:type I restriction enzyme M protein
VDRTHRDLSDDDIERITRAYHAWRGEPKAGPNEDVPGFCKSATLEEISAHSHVPIPGRYVGSEALEGDGESFEDKMARLTATLEEQFAESARLEARIKESFERLGL